MSVTERPCPRVCGGRLHALISADGSAWEADYCDTCGCRWWHDPPRSAADAPKDEEDAGATPAVR